MPASAPYWTNRTSRQCRCIFPPAVSRLWSLCGRLFAAVTTAASQCWRAFAHGSARNRTIAQVCHEKNAPKGRPNRPGLARRDADAACHLLRKTVARRGPNNGRNVSSLMTRAGKCGISTRTKPGRVYGINRCTRAAANRRRAQALRMSVRAMNCIQHGGCRAHALTRAATLRLSEERMA